MKGAAGWTVMWTIWVTDWGDKRRKLHRVTCGDVHATTKAARRCMERLRADRAASKRPDDYTDWTICKLSKVEDAEP